MLNNERKVLMFKRTMSFNLNRVRLKLCNEVFVIFLLFLIVNECKCNRPPRFLTDGLPEIVLRLKEGYETPIGTIIHKLQGEDPDNDRLKFGIRFQSGSEVIRIENISDNEANIILDQELDRETRDEYALVLTLTDGKLGSNNFITQSLLILVEDVNDNVPIFKPYQPSITLREDSKPGMVTTLEATDADEGAYGQVVYYLQQSDENLFSIATSMGKGIIKLIGSLDYERQTLHQVKVLAIDRAKQGRINTGTAAVVIKVEDVDDRPPEFVRVLPVARISEGVPIGTAVMQVKAIDGDRGINNSIGYSIGKLTETKFQLFEIEKMTGIIFTNKILDREAYHSTSAAHILQITATEIGSKLKPAPSTQTEVTIIISDLNDETPTFRSKKYNCEIPENSPTNTPVTFLEKGIPEVYDYDQGNNGTFNLFLKGAETIFEITPNKVTNEATFMIRIKDPTILDYEQIKEINFTIIAKEIVKYKPKYSEVPVKVTILDRNDNYPEFVKSSYEVSVQENCEIGTTVAWVQALDGDSGNYGTKGVRYTNLSGSIENLLYLHPTTGIITVKQPGGPNFDREQIQRHYLTVEARDNLGNGNRNTVQLIVNIEDLNDNPPIFTQSLYEARLLENRNDFEKPLKVEARDADLTGTNNSLVEYLLLGEYANNFTIHSLYGIITPKEPLDFEKIPGISSENIRLIKLLVKASDFGVPKLSSEIPLTIYLQDVNDYPPIFEKNFYNTSIKENIQGGTTILTISAKDFDGSYPNNHIFYRIQDGAFDKFTINSDSGTISVSRGAILDPDLTEPKRTKYSLTVVALDGASGDNQLQTQVQVNITILDVNNKAPILSDPGIIEIPENLMPGSVITKISAIDFDSNPEIKYILDGENCKGENERGFYLSNEDFDCENSFVLDEETGILSINRILDREIVEIIKLGIKAEDVASENGPQIAKAILTVLIKDANDNNPKFRQPFYRFSIQENSKSGVLIGNVIADDPDKNKSIIYDLEARKEILKLISLNNKTGDLFVKSRIDREVYDWLNLTVKATDSGHPPRHARTEIFVQILDENDNNPCFLNDPRVLMVPEDTEVNRKIAIIEARDSDSGEFGKITYLLDRSSSEGDFILEPETGILRVSKELDRETKHSYLLVVEAWDNYQFGFNSGESRNAFKHINVTVLDVNDNPPQFSLPTTCTSITEFHEIGHPIIIVHATDSDDPESPNGQIIMDISSGNDNDLFALQQINEFSAEITPRKSLRGKHGNYSLFLRAQDLGQPRHMVEDVLKICVLDYNDHAPVFITPPHNSTLKVPENATVGSALVQIQAKDEDIGPNGMIRYKLKSDPAGHFKTFDLQPISGILELRLPLNREKQKIYDIRIEAYDLGTPTALSSDLDLTVYVSNVNLFQPQFLNDEFIVNFTENKPPGLEIRKIPETIDRDMLEYEGPPSPICYFIVQGNEDDLFKLDALKHQLMVNKELDREKREIYNLKIKATEDCRNGGKNQKLFNDDPTILKVIVRVDDVNDNPPRFLHRIFTGGVSTATDFGTKFMKIQATDIDDNENSKISYFLIGKVRMTLTEGLENLQRPPFLVNQKTGEVQLNFDPQQGMKGYFDFMVLANDTGGLEDMARVFIYLLREDQRVRFVLRLQPQELRDKIEIFRETLGNVTGAIVNIDEFRLHLNQDATIDKTRTDLYLHLVDKKYHSILEVAEVLKLIDQNTEKLDSLFKEFNVLDTQPADSLALLSIQTTSATFWLTASTLFLFLLLMLSLAICASQRSSYHRKLKAATATAYVSADSDLGRGLSAISGRVPNTNKHSMEGSNPIWLKAYENEWYKHADDFSNGSEREDSLDENVLSNNSDEIQCRHEQCSVQDRLQNLYQTLPPILPPRKLETTEL
nr:cadherin-23 [Onthophagus taurus]